MARLYYADISYVFNITHFMKIHTLALTLMSVVALTAGCTAVNRIKPVQGSLAKTQQFSNKSGSPVMEFTPPQGSDWYETERTRSGLIVYGKKRNDPSNTVVAYVFIVDSNQKFSDAKEFLKFVKKERAKDKDESRFSMLSDAQSMDEKKLERCVKYQYKALDNSITQKMNESVFFSAKGYTCQHPTKPHIITIEYSERGKSPFDDAALVAEGKAFINSLVLN